MDKARCQPNELVSFYPLILVQKRRRNYVEKMDVLLCDTRMSQVTGTLFTGCYWVSHITKGDE